MLISFINVYNRFEISWTTLTSPGLHQAKNVLKFALHSKFFDMPCKILRLAASCAGSYLH